METTRIPKWVWISLAVLAVIIIAFIIRRNYKRNQIQSMVDAMEENPDQLTKTVLDEIATLDNFIN